VIVGGDTLTLAFPGALGLLHSVEVSCACARS